MAQNTKYKTTIEDQLDDWRMLTYLKKQWHNSLTRSQKMRLGWKIKDLERQYYIDYGYHHNIVDDDSEDDLLKGGGRND